MCQKLFENITLVSEAILRSLEAILNENLQKVIEGSEFWKYVIKQQMLIDTKYLSSDVIREYLESKTWKWAKNITFFSVI